MNWKRKTLRLIEKYGAPKLVNVDFKREFSAGAAFVLLRKGENVVLVRHKTGGERGRASKKPFHWDLPGGACEEDEDFEEAAKREAYEETGLEIKIEKLLAIYDYDYVDPQIRYGPIALFEAKVVSGRLQIMDPDSEALEVKEFSKINEEEFGEYKVAKEFLKKYGYIYSS